MVILLNALPLNMFSDREVLLKITRIDIEELRNLLEKEEKIECYIRHTSTVNLLNKMFDLNLKISNELYKYREGDKIIVVSLRKPTRGKEVEVKPEDIEFYLVEKIRK